MRLVHESGNAGQKLPNPIREHVEVGGEKWMDIERRLRQRMRIYPEKLRAMIRSRAEYDLELGQLDVRLPAGGRESVSDPETGQRRAKAVTSIRGRDVEEIESEHPLAS